MSKTKRRYLPFTAGSVVLTVLAVVVLAPLSASAQQTVAPVVGEKSLTLDMQVLLDAVLYDPAAQGPLLVVAPPRAFMPATPVDPVAAPSRFTLGMLAALAGYRVVAMGGITAVVPQKMTVIVTKPGKANPYAGIGRTALMKVLMGSLTPSQWAALGGETGLAAGDLDEDQRLMFDRILPETPQMVRRTRDKALPGEMNQERIVSRTPLDRNGLRLRVSRRVAFYFEYKPDSSAGNDASDRPDVGEMKDMLETGTETGSDPADPDDARSPVAYGQTLLKTVPNQPKPSDLDFHARILDARVGLAPAPGANGDVTLGELVGRVARATGLDLIADKRVAVLPVYVRGTDARTGDVLEALCRGVTGTFRRVGITQTFVLTDDRDGIGARYGRLAEWADGAETTGAGLLTKATAAITKANGIEYIRFAPGDPLAPSAAQQARLESGWKTGEWAPMVAMTTLSEPLQRAASRSFDTLLQTAAGNPELASARKDSFHLAEGMRADWIVPGVGTLPDFALLSQGGPSLGDFVEKTPKVTPPAPTASTTTASAAPRPKRSVLLVRVASPGDTAALIAAAGQHGFNEVWLQVGLDDISATTALLDAAVAAGKQDGIAVGAALDLLRGPGLPGEADRNILGETGAEFTKRQAARKITDALPLHGYDGWVVPTGDTIPRIAARVGQIASLPGLACAVVRAASAPGCARVPAEDPQERPRGDGVAVNGSMGYTDAMRIAFLRTHGIDPIDIPEIGPLRRLLSLPFFPNTTEYRDGRIGPVNGAYYGRDPSQRTALADWREFRYQQSEDAIAAIYDALRKICPTVPLLIDDRANSYIRDIWGSWFTTWDRRTALPRNRALYPRKEGLKQARTAGATEVLNRTGFGEDPRKPDTLDQFVVRATDSFAYAVSEGWNGIVIDQSNSVPAETLRRLKALPLGPTPSRHRLESVR